MSEFETDDYKYSRLAVDKAKLCPVDFTAKNPIPRVAIVIANESKLLGWCAKGVGGEFWNSEEIFQPFSLSPSEHAEKALLEKLMNFDLSNAKAYVTLEPCTKRRKGTSCAELLIASGIKCVFIGNIDPNPDVGALAWQKFFDSRIVIKDFASELRNEAIRDNHAFFSKFRTSIFDEGGASFDYMNNGGERILGVAGKEFKTRWTNRGNGSIYALDYEFNVAIAKNCSSFDQIDDPGRWFEDCHYTKPASEGDIVIFRNKEGFALVKINSVKTQTKTSNAELNFRYQLRYRAH